MLEVGAKPVFVDIDPVTRAIDLARAEAAITPRTRALIPVDLAGLPVDRDRLNGLARRRGLRVVEDAAQSFGSTWKGARIGSFGDLVSLSFHANKNITTSEGGCLVLNDEKEARLAEQYRLQGVVRTGHDGMDVRGRRREVQHDRTSRRGSDSASCRTWRSSPRRGATSRGPTSRSSTGPPCAPLGLGMPVANFTDSNWHMFQVMLPEDRLSVRRSAVMEEMKLAGIGTGVPLPGDPTSSPCTGGWDGRRATSPRGTRGPQPPHDPALPRDDPRRRGPGRRDPGLDPRKAPQGMSSAPALSVVIPVFNEELNLRSSSRGSNGPRRARPHLRGDLHETDGSSDRSLDLLRAQHRARPKVTRVIDFNANYGQHMAIMAAFERVRGDVVVTLDADLQNPPRRSRSCSSSSTRATTTWADSGSTDATSLFRTAASRVINFVRSRTTSIEMTDQGCMLRAYSRPIIDAIVQSGATNTFIPALAYSFSGNPTEVGVKHEERNAGVSNYSL